MSQDNVPLYAFNRGLISPLGLARADIKRQALSSEEQTNWMPRVLGSMMLRPGFGYIREVKSDLPVMHIPFIYASTDTAAIEFTNNTIRVSVNDVNITRPAVATTITNPNFTSDLSGWTDADESGTTSVWATGGYMSLKSSTFAYAVRKQTLTVASGDLNKEHALRIVVNRGIVVLRVGSADTLDDFISETQLGPGTHSLTFTPTGNAFIYLASATSYATLLDSINIEASGVMELPSPYLTADLPYIRFDQSADVIYLACRGYIQKKIERRSTHSWSIVDYLPLDGPYRNANISVTQMKPTALSGDITLTTDHAFFKANHVGAIFSIDSIGQNVLSTLAGDNQYTNPVRVTGVGAQRAFIFSVTTGYTGTLTLQRSVGDVGAWVDVFKFTANFTGSQSYNDGFDNQIIYYRVGFDPGGWATGTTDVGITYASGSITGNARITGFTDNKNVSAVVINAFGGTTFTQNWSEGLWSPYRGYPTSVVLYEGRLWWAGKANILGSISDAYESFDPTQVGDAGPINRTIGQGPVDNINWLLGLSRLLVGTDMREINARSTSFDEPLTPSNFNLKDASTQGSAPVAAVKVDDKGLFTQKSKNKLYQLSVADSSTTYDYSAADLMEFTPEVGQPGIVKILVQRQPDTRIHVLRADGLCAVLVSAPGEDVLCWVMVQTDGLIEDGYVLPGTLEDQVYYAINRTINGVTKRYVEKWALESECVGATLNKQADCFITYSGTATNVITGLGYLEGKQVIVWADGKDLSPLDVSTRLQKTYLVSGGQITLDAGITVSNAVIGTGYEARFKSTKLSYAAQLSTALGQNKLVDHLGVILKDTHSHGLRYGPGFDKDPTTGAYLYMDDMPINEDGADVPYDQIWPSYDKESIEFEGIHDPDARLCLLATAPRPVTCLAAIIGMETNEKR